MNWLERARREIGGTVGQPTAVTAERNPTAVMAVPHPAPGEELAASFGSNGSATPTRIQLPEALCEAFEERAAIMEFDGGMSREDAELAALALILRRGRLH